MDLFIEQSIDIPRIVVLPKGEVASGFHDFDMDVSGIRLQPVAMDILIQHLRTHARERLVTETDFVKEERLENYLVRALIDFDDICYDEHADLLYKLVGQVVSHLLSYLPDEQAVVRVLLYHQQQLAEFVHAQMQAHYWENATAYETHVSKGFTTLRPNSYSTSAGEPVRNFRTPVEQKQGIRDMLFGGFRRCLYRTQKFDSDTERRFAIILEDDAEVLKWFKPTRGQFQLHYRNDQSYEPDFVVETKDAKFLCEPKRANEIQDEDVQAKARAAVVWCQRATEHEQKQSGKGWRYLLIPHDAITASKTLRGLASTFAAVSPEIESLGGKA